MKFCIKCGISLPDEAVFCSKCGLHQPNMPDDIGDAYSPNQTQMNQNYINSPQMPYTMQPPYIPQQQFVSQPPFYNPSNVKGYYPQVPPQFVPQNPPPYFDPRQTLEQQTFEKVEKRVKTTLFFVWSIILIFIFNPLGTPLAIISTLFAGMARSSDATDEQAQKNIKTSKIICIIATIIDVICIIALALLFFYLIRTGNNMMPSGDGTQV